LGFRVQGFKGPRVWGFSAHLVCILRELERRGALDEARENKRGILDGHSVSRGNSVFESHLCSFERCRPSLENA